MPREYKKRIKGQRQVVAQETFDFTVPQRRGAARPVDPYVKQYSSSKARNIVDFVNSFNSASKTIMQANEVFKGNQREKGKVSAARGEKVSKDAHWSFLEGYENYKGLAAVADYQAELSQLHKSFESADPETYNAEVEKLNAQFINGRSDAFLKGFTPSALKSQEYFVSQYGIKQGKLLKDEALTDARKITRVKLQEIMESDVPKQAMRKFLTEMQKGNGISKKLRLSTTEITREIVDTVGEYAPEMLDAFELPDESGIRPTDNEGIRDLVDAYKQSKKAEVATKKLTTAYDKVYAEFTKEGSRETDWVKAVDALGDPKYRKELGLDIKEASSLQSMMQSQQIFEVRQKAQAKEDAKVDALNSVFKLVNENDFIGAMTELGKTDLPESDKFQLKSGLAKAQKESDPLQYYSTTQRIVSGKYISDSSIMLGVGTKYSFEDMERLLRLNKLMRSKDGKRIAKGVEILEKGLGKSMLQAETPASAERLNGAVNALWDAVEDAQKAGKPVRDLFIENSPDYILNKIMGSYRLSAEEQLEDQMKFLRSDDTEKLKRKAFRSFDSFIEMYLFFNDCASDPATIKGVKNNPKNKEALMQRWKLFKQGDEEQWKK